MLTYEHGYDHVATLAPDCPLNFVLDIVGLDTERVWCQTFLEGIRSKMTCRHFDTFRWFFDWDAFMQLDTESVEYDPLFSFLCTYLWGWKIVRIGGEGWCPWHLVHNLNKTFGKIKMKFGKLKHVVGELDRFVRSFFMKLSKECYLTPSTQNMW